MITHKLGTVKGRHEIKEVQDMFLKVFLILQM